MSTRARHIYRASSAARTLYLPAEKRLILRLRMEQRNRQSFPWAEGRPKPYNHLHEVIKKSVLLKCAIIHEPQCDARAFDELGSFHPAAFIGDCEHREAKAGRSDAGNVSWIVGAVREVAVLRQAGGGIGLLAEETERAMLAFFEARIADGIKRIFRYELTGARGETRSGGVCGRCCRQKWRAGGESCEIAQHRTSRTQHFEFRIKSYSDGQEGSETRMTADAKRLLVWCALTR